MQTEHEKVPKLLADPKFCCGFGVKVRRLTHDAALSAAVVDQLSSRPQSNSFLQSIKEQRLRHFLPSNAQHLTPSDRRWTEARRKYLIVLYI